MKIRTPDQRPVAVVGSRAQQGVDMTRHQTCLDPLRVGQQVIRQDRGTGGAAKILLAALRAWSPMAKADSTPHRKAATDRSITLGASALRSRRMMWPLH